ncbi:MAG: DedA family protein [Candidatus Dormibacteria bacterium]
MNGVIDGLLRVIAGVPAPEAYLLITAWLSFESAGVPIPNEAVLLYAGFLVASGRIAFLPAVAAAVLGSCIGATASYAAGRYGGRPFLHRYGRYILLTEHRLDRAEGWFRHRGRSTIFVARLTPVVRTVISYPAGLARMGYRPFIVSTVAGAAIWCIAAVAVGMAAGSNWGHLFDLAHRYGPVAGVGVLMLALAYFLLERRVKAALFD